jgi:hypothetical protein
MLALGLVALAVGIAIALTAGSDGKRHHGHGAGRRAGESSAAAGSDSKSGTGSGGSRAQTPSRTVLAANYLGLTTAQLHDRLKRGQSLADVAAGIDGRSAQGLIETLVAAQAARLKAMKLPATTQRTRLTRYRQRIERLVSHRRAAPAIERDLLVASRYLDIGDGRLHTLLEQGRTLAQIAAATHGRSTAGLEAAILAARRSDLKTAASSGLLSHKDETAALAALPGAVEAELRRELLQR